MSSESISGQINTGTQSRNEGLINIKIQCIVGPSEMSCSSGETFCCLTLQWMRFIYWVLYQTWLIVGHGCLSIVSVVCCQVEVSATDWSLVQRSPTDCGASCVIKKPENEEAKAHYGAMENTTKRVVTPRKQTNKQTNISAWQQTIILSVNLAIFHID